MDGELGPHQEKLSYEARAERLSVYYETLAKLFSPDLIVVGGGLSNAAKRLLHLIDTRGPLVAATLRDRAGVVGAALWASESD